MVGDGFRRSEPSAYDAAVTAAGHAAGALFLDPRENFPTFFSFGPHLIPLDEIRSPLAEIEVRTVHNGAVHRRNTVSNMAFSPEFLVSFHSEVMPLFPGDIISTGTPGSATAATAPHPGIRLVGVEPEAGYRTTIAVPAPSPTAKPPPPPAELTFAVNQRPVEAIALVDDDEIRHAMRFAFERLKITVEPSGATGLAAPPAGRVAPPLGRVGVIISGGDIDSQRFADLCGR